MNYDKRLFKGEPKKLIVTNEKGEFVMNLYSTGHHLFHKEADAWELLRIDRECAICQSLIGSTLTLTCTVCDEKKDIEEYNRLPYEKPTEYVYSKALDKYFLLDDVDLFLDDEHTDVDSLRLLNTEEEHCDAFERFQDAILDYLDQVDDFDDFDIPESLFRELGNLVLPKIYYPANTKPKL